MESSWIPLERISRLLQLETAILVLLYPISTYVFYRLFLRRLSSERHQNLGNHFRNLLMHTILGASFYAVYWAALQAPAGGSLVTVLLPYASFLSLVWGLMIVVKSSRIAAYEYLFLNSMRMGVPLLLINILTLILTIVLVALVLTEVFQVRLSSVLATSAVLSIVLGLALQETLGNLFAGVALQFDKPYNIGDWIEVDSGSQRWRGQVFEISWRSTLLLGFADELITIPNRVMAQAHISNWSILKKPFIRSQLLRLRFDADIELARQLALDVARRTEGIVDFPQPMALLIETKESWLELKLIYFITNYGDQFIIGDRLLTRLLSVFREREVHLAPPRLELTQKEA